MNIKTSIQLSMAFLISLFIFSSGNLFAQAPEKKTDSFKVYGNCEMCQERIESVLKRKDGILKKEWNPDTKMLKVSYDPEKITLIQIKQKIADEGYDTDDVHAKDQAYNNLSKCCRYERAKK